MRTTQRELREGNPTIDEMRDDLAEYEAMNMNTSDIIDMLIYGVEPLDECPAIQVKDEWQQTFGKLKKLGDKIMKLEEALYIVINEAETSALGDKSDEQLKILGAIEIVQAFYEEHGHHFSNFFLTIVELSNNVYSY